MNHLSKSTFAIIAASLVFVSFALASCEKENANLTPQEQASFKAAPGMGPKDTIYLPGSTTKHYYDNGGSDYGCKNGGHGCLEPLDVAAEFHAEVISIANGIQCNPSLAPVLFKQNEELLRHVFDEIIIRSVIENVVTVSVRVETTENKYTYFIFKGKFIHGSEYVVPICK